MFHTHVVIQKLILYPSIPVYFWATFGDAVMDDAVMDNAVMDDDSEGEDEIESVEGLENLELIALTQDDRDFLDAIVNGDDDNDTNSNADSLLSSGWMQDFFCKIHSLVYKQS